MERNNLTNAEVVDELCRLRSALKTDYAGTPAFQISRFISALDKAIEDAMWIPVTKKLPPVNSEVIVTDRDVITSYQATYVGNGYWECDNGTFNDRVVAWKWFPETYKVEGEVT